MEYTNKSFLEYIKQTFNEPYNFGIHNINLNCYKSAVRMDRRYIMNTKNITTRAIAKNILKKGLFVYEKDRGLTSTVAFINNNYKGNNLENVDSSIFDYDFQTEGDESFDKIINIFVAIPNFLLLDDKEYFIGNLFQPINIGNKILFNDHLPKEFIYGYYVKKASFNPYALYHVEYKNDLEFHLNKNHIFLKTKQEQEAITRNLLQEKRQTKSLLEAVNSYDEGNYIVEHTKKQKEKLGQMTKRI